MKRILLAASLCLALGLFPLSASAKVLFSFNTVSAKDFVEICKAEGINIPEEVAKSLVETREKQGKFKTAADLKKVPGMKPMHIHQLQPLEENDDLLFDPENAPGMKGY